MQIPLSRISSFPFTAQFPENLSKAGLDTSPILVPSCLAAFGDGAFARIAFRSTRSLHPHGGGAGS